MSCHQAFIQNSEQLINLALDEDLGVDGDVTSQALVDLQKRGHAQIIAKEAGILAGLTVAKRVFERINEKITFESDLNDGNMMKPFTKIARISGEATSILTAERTALNFLQRLSGIATLTAKFVEKVKGTKAKILDTRKTTPGFRELEKYAVRMGGGYNHRQGLFDMVLIKENHISIAGGIPLAINKSRQYLLNKNLDSKIEIEVQNLKQAEEALRLEVDRLLLDNMTPADVRKVVQLTVGKTELEVSGGVNLDTVRDYAETGVDFISVGALTHSAPALDLSLLLDVSN